jgi:hypothetical protein
MNDKWFNIAMIIVMTSLVANGFVLMLTSFPNGNQFNGLHRSELDYENIKSKYDPSINTNTPIGTSATNYDGSGFNPITTATNDPFGLSGLFIIIQAVVGLELLLLTLASVFSLFSVLFYMIILLMLAVKIVVVAYFASILIRLIFGGRQ